MDVTRYMKMGTTIASMKILRNTSASGTIGIDLEEPYIGPRE